jgi:hypothetical protein
MSDPVNHPSHYVSGSIECIDAIEAALTPEEFRGYLRGCSLKYQWRCGKKDDAVQDLDKSIWYARKLKDVLKCESKLTQKPTRRLWRLRNAVAWLRSTLTASLNR